MNFLKLLDEVKIFISSQMKELTLKNILDFYTKNSLSSKTTELKYKYTRRISKTQVLIKSIIKNLNAFSNKNYCADLLHIFTNFRANLINFFLENVNHTKRVHELWTY